MPKYRITIEVDLPGCPEVTDLFERRDANASTSPLREVLAHPNWWSMVAAERIQGDTQ
jgi:hypothetical protein